METYSSPPTPQPFYQIWIKAISKPNEQAYREIASAPDASVGKALLWVFLVALISGLLSAISVSVGGTYSSLFQELPTGTTDISPGVVLISALCAAPFGALFGVVIFAIGFALIQWVARLLGGSGTYAQLIYTVAAFVAPLGLIGALMSMLTLIPYVGLCFTLFNLLISLYLLYLEILAIKAVNAFGWLQAIGALFLPGLVIGFLCACLAAVAVIALGPAIQDIFEQLSLIILLVA